MSHTVKVDLKMKSMDALVKSAEQLGYHVLGHGTHHLFAGPATGMGISIPGWNYPIVIDSNGEASYDNYNGAWGNISKLNDLTDNYTIFAAQEAATQQGWVSEVNERGELVIMHPDGGQLTVTKQGVIDAQGFSGSSCALATQPIEQALGQRASEVRKSEYTESHLSVGESED